MVIQIYCPSCSASFPVDTNKIPEAGVNARCSSCGDVFRVERPVAIEELSPDTSPEVTAQPEPAPESAVMVEPEPESSAVPEAEAEPEPEVEPAVEPEAEPEPEVEQQLERASDAESELEPAPEPEPEPEPEPDFAIESEEEITADAGAEAPEDRHAADRTAPAEEAAPAVTGFSFGKRDPKDKAKRLARVLVSDMTMYNADLHESALAGGTLKEDFGEEIERSWKEYVEQVGAEMAEGEGQDFWRQALNDVLAKGEQIF